MATVGLCVPHGDKVSPMFYRHLMAMQWQFPQHTFIHVEVDCHVVGKARNMLVQAGEPEDLDVYWFIDDDTLVPPDAGVLIDQALKLGVVSGVYFARRPPFTPHIYSLATEKGQEGKYWPKVDYPSGGITEEDGIGAGCLCIKADIFEKLRDIWLPRIEVVYEAVKDLDKSIAIILKDMSPWFEFLDAKGEDLYFSERCRDAEIPIWVNWDVKCMHLAMLGITEDHFKYLHNNKLLYKVGEEPVVGTS